jgi:hypothetical protein
VNVMIVAGCSRSGETLVLAPAGRLRMCSWLNSTTTLREHGQGQDIVTAARQVPAIAVASNGELWRGLNHAIVVGPSLAPASAGPGAQPWQPIGETQCEEFSLR